MTQKGGQQISPTPTPWDQYVFTSASEFNGALWSFFEALEQYEKKMWEAEPSLLHSPLYPRYYVVINPVTQLPVLSPNARRAFFIRFHYALSIGQFY